MRLNLFKVIQIKESGFNYPELDRKIKTPEDINNILKNYLHLENESVENFGIINLNTKNQIVGIHIISKGTLDSTLVHPREVFKAAILNNASSIILFHNHPSGDPTPSKEDIKVTKRLQDGAEILGIEILDHIIIGHDRYSSFKEMGLLS